MTQDSFEVFGFAEPLSRALTQCGYATPTPVQAQALQPQLDGRDLLALAETGSGKTAAFLLPILQEFSANTINPNPREVLALVLAPTRELALQIDQEVASLTRNLHFIRRAVVLGGVSKGPQINALKRGVHILVATPGRLLDLVNERYGDLRPVRAFVLDEADRMFDMGFIRDIRKIASMLSHKRRTAMFSATMPTEIRKLAHELLNDPYRVDLSPKQVVVDRIDQKVMIVRATEKQSRLHTLLKDEAFSRVIVFTRTKRGADRVTSRLAMAGIGAVAIHGNKAQNARQRALKDFSMGHMRVLVATDIAARGIDVSDVSHVINFELPVEPETYVHRIGRTARKGLSGVAISLCDPSEKTEIYAIERLMKQPIEVIEDVGGENLPAFERQGRDDERPRREGGHRNGGERGQRNGGAQGERRGHGRGPDRARGEGRSHERSARPDRGERPQHTAATGEPSQERRPHQGHSDRTGPRPEGRGDGRRDQNRENHRGPGHDRKPSGRPEHRHAAGSSEQSASGEGARHERRAPRPQSNRDGGQRKPEQAAREAAHGRASARPHGSHQARNHETPGPARERAKEHRAHERHAEPGAPREPRREGKPSWNSGGQRPPKFLNGSAPRSRGRNNGPAA